MTRLADLDPIDQDIFSDLQQQVQQMTRAFIQMCLSAYLAKQTCKRSEWKAIEESLEWTAITATPYAKVGEFIVEIELNNLDLLDCNTIKALCCDRFKPILERLKSERLTVAEVRQEMAAINKSMKKEKRPQGILEWKRAKTGERSLIICVNDAEAGAEFEGRFKSSCLPLPWFLRRLLRQQPVQQDVTWQPASSESATQMLEELAPAEEIAEIEEKIRACYRTITEYATSTDPAEKMILSLAKEHKVRLQELLQSNSMSASPTLVSFGHGRFKDST
ncbi:MAG TPA: hypothetical protein VE956_05365 [Nodularia sp. (in: cyanobacteria)]|nr:hypothetical protein [Nodularia sp. (in: cyanobacteria)]